MDIKPHNIIITETNSIKLVDFGESQQLPESDSDLVLLTQTGTPFFMAPELKKLKLNVNEISDETAMIDGCKADIYSLGISMLLLMNPFVKKSPDILL